jgi:prepilin-type processing-associated H-X9-DG protein
MGPGNCFVGEPGLLTTCPTASRDRPLRSRTKRGVTALELVLVVIVLAVLAWLVVAVFARRREEDRRRRCMNYLNGMAKGMATYINEHGDNRWYPCPLGRGRNPDDFNGAEWLVALHWTGVVPDTVVFTCPSSGDTNRDGLDLGTRRAPATFGSQTVSYAALHYYSLTDASGRPRPGAIPDDILPGNAPIASDDTQGTINHAATGGMNVMFADTHAERRTRAELDPEHAVGQAGGLLQQLRN